MRVAIMGGVLRRLVVPLATTAFCFASMTHSADAANAPIKQIHEIPFFVHENLLNPGMGMDLAFFQNLIDTAIADTQQLLVGTQGPFDQPCCSEIIARGTPGATLTLFSGADAGRPQGDLNIVDFTADRSDLQSIVGAGSGVFFVDSLSNCAGSADAIGCGQTPPACTGNPNDNPDLIIVITLDALEFSILGQTLAHERGHNACLVHEDTTEQCQLMRPAAGGGCLTASECSNFMNGRTATGGSCECHADSSSIIADATTCFDEGIAGTCSGGLCDPPTSETSTRLIASADPNLIVYTDTIGTEIFDARLALSGATGNWRNDGPWGNTDEPQGLAYAPGRDVLYGVTRTSGSDELLRIQPTSGSTISRTPILGRSDIIALAWYPGTSSAPGDDRLFGLDSDGSFETLIEIDPDTGQSITIGGLDFGSPPSRVTGMAYDPVNDDLYVSSFGGLFVVDRARCNNPTFCVTTELVDPLTVTPAKPQGTTLARIGSGLAYSSVTGNLYMIGNQAGISLPGPFPPAGTFRTTAYVVILGGTIRAGIPGGANFVDTLEPIGLEGMTVGGLATFPAPEPDGLFLWAAALITLVALRQRDQLAPFQ